MLQKTKHIIADELIVHLELIYTKKEKKTESAVDDAMEGKTSKKSKKSKGDDEDYEEDDDE